MHRTFLSTLFACTSLKLQSADPGAWKEFASGNFTVNTNNSVPFTRIGIDNAMEHLNKVINGQGGISGITSSLQALLKFCLTGPELARLTEETKQLVTIADRATVQQHHCLSQAKIARQEQAITKLKDVLAECHLFDPRDDVDRTSRDGIFKLMSKELIPNKEQESILSTEQAGMDAFTQFVEQRITGGGNLWDRTTKVKLLTWNTAAKEIKVKSRHSRQPAPSLPGCCW